MKKAAARTWVHSIQELRTELATWLRSADFRILDENVPIERGEIILRAMNQAGELLLEPAEVHPGPHPQVVRLYGLPYLRQVLLVGPDPKGKWQVTTTQGIPLRVGWSSTEILGVVKDILVEPVRVRR